MAVKKGMPAGGNPAVMAAAQKGKDTGKVPSGTGMVPKLRASGGRVGCDSNPYSSARGKK